MTAESFFRSGHVADLIIVVMLAEWAWRSYRYRVSGNGCPSSHIFASLAPGVCLVLALRAALTGADWPWMALALAASGVAHAIDGRLRYRDRSAAPVDVSERTGRPPTPPR